LRGEGGKHATEKANQYLRLTGSAVQTQGDVSRFHRENNVVEITLK